MFTKLLFIALPVSFCLLVAFAPDSEKDKKKSRDTHVVFDKGNIVELKDVKIVMEPYRKKIEAMNNMFLYTDMPDSLLMKDWETGEMKMQRVPTEKIPVTINGKPIMGNERKFYTYIDKSYVAPFLPGHPGSIDDYLFTALKTELEKLDDGGYTLGVNNLVVDNAGNIAYYEAKGINIFMSPLEKQPKLTDAAKRIINQKIISALMAPVKFQPALIKNTPVNARVSTDNYSIVVKGHRATLVARMGC